MKVRSIFAKNVFNFGPQGIEWKDIPDRSILVGPNGSGKTNIFRLLTLVADSFVYATKAQHPEIDQRLFEVFQTPDSKAKIEFELADEEVVAICDWLTLTAFEQVQDFRRNWQPQIQESPDPITTGSIANESERVVKKILKESADSFKKLIGNSITLVIEGSGNPRNPARQYAIVRSDVPHLYSTTSWPLTTDPYANGGTPVYLPDSVWKKFIEFSPQASKRGSSESTLNDNDVATFLQKYGIDWLQAFSSQSAQVLPGVPMTLWNQVQMSDEDFIPFIQRIRDFLKSRNYIADSIGLLDLFGLIFRGSIVRVSEIRARPSKSEVAFIPPPFEKTLTIDGSGLAPLLFQMKNGFGKVERELYQNLRNSFREVTGSDLNFEFDVVAYDESAQDENASSNLKCEVTFVDLNSNTELSAEYVPGSVIETLTLLASVALSEAKRCVLLLDEPALNLHPTMQRKLADQILDVRKRMYSQCFLVTHAPYFIPDDFTPNDTNANWSLFRLSGSGNGVTIRVPNPGSGDRNELYLCRKAWRANSRLRASLFARKVILAEGEDEEAALPIWFSKCNGAMSFESRNIMFVSVHGDQNFRVTAKTLSIWGIPQTGIGDSKAPDVYDVDGFRVYHYDLEEFSDFYKREPYMKIYNETPSSARYKTKDPLVARAVAEETPPPEEICRLWDRIKDFVLMP